MPKKKTTARPSGADVNTIGKILCIVLFKFAFCMYFVGQIIERVTQHAYFFISKTSINDGKHKSLSSMSLYPQKKVSSECYTYTFLSKWWLNLCLHFVIMLKLWFKVRAMIKTWLGVPNKKSSISHK